MKKYVLLFVLIGFLLVGCGNSTNNLPNGPTEAQPTEFPPTLMPTSTPLIPTSTPLIPTPTSIPCLFAFTSGNEERQNIYVMDGNGGAVRQLNVHDGIDGAISWSPSGGQIVFDSRRDNEWNLFLMNVDGSNETQLTFSQKSSRHPYFSPDGTQIVYSQAGDDDKSHLFIMDTDGGNQRQLTFGDASEYEPVWSPDGSQIVYYSDANWASGLFEIFIIDAGGGDQQQLTDDPAFDWNCGWMPDGSKIFFIRDFSLATMDADGSNLEIIIDEDISSPSWSPNGSQIAFGIKGDDGSHHIYIMDADGGNVRQFIMIEGSQWSGTWSPVCNE